MSPTVLLANMRRTESGRVRSVHTADRDEICRLLEAGILQETAISVIQKDSHHVLISAGDREVAMEMQVAAHVIVELT